MTKVNELRRKPHGDILDCGLVSSWQVGRAREMPSGSTVMRRAEVPEVAGTRLLT